MLILLTFQDCRCISEQKFEELVNEVKSVREMVSEIRGFLCSVPLQSSTSTVPIWTNPSSLPPPIQGISLPINHNCANCQFPMLPLYPVSLGIPDCLLDNLRFTLSGSGLTNFLSSPPVHVPAPVSLSSGSSTHFPFKCLIHFPIVYCSSSVFIYLFMLSPSTAVAYYDYNTSLSTGP